MPRRAAPRLRAIVTAIAIAALVFALGWCAWSSSRIAEQGRAWDDRAALTTCAAVRARLGPPDAVTACRERHLELMRFSPPGCAEVLWYDTPITWLPNYYAWACDSTGLVIDSYAFSSP